jgi:hypothetical protein
MRPIAINPNALCFCCRQDPFTFLGPPKDVLIQTSKENPAQAQASFMTPFGYSLTLERGRRGARLYPGTPHRKSLVCFREIIFRLGPGSSRHMSAPIRSASDPLRTLLLASVSRISCRSGNGGSSNEQVPDIDFS